MTRLVPDPNGHQAALGGRIGGEGDDIRFIQWLLSALGLVARGFDATNGAGPGVRLDEAKRRADADAAHRRRQDYRP